MSIYLKRAVIILIIMTLVVTYLTLTLYEKNIKVAFNGAKAPVVIIDAGHGDPDGGAIGVTGVLESEINLQISKKISAKLKEKCYNVVMTRENNEGIYKSGSKIKEKKLSDMHERERIMNSHNQSIFISIHMNSFSDETVSGAQVFYSKNNLKSKDLGEAIREELIKLAPKNDRILKIADKSIYLMEKANVPACLIECGFLSNYEDEEMLKSEAYQEKIAYAVANGIEKYFSGGFYEK